ncbi:uncharacterized protein [Procambarus clarkii]|uniref:uncharacterized protein n=1 Tax=Procambarus clarkii TaxID=6728 RepID=UPI00374289FC
MKWLVVIALHHLVHSASGAPLEDGTSSYMVAAHTPTAPPTYPPTHTGLRWVPPAPPDSSAGVGVASGGVGVASEGVGVASTGVGVASGGVGVASAGVGVASEGVGVAGWSRRNTNKKHLWRHASQTHIRSETPFKNTTQILRFRRDARETHVPRTPVVLASLPRSGSPAPVSTPVSWLPGTPLALASDRTTTMPFFSLVRPTSTTAATSTRTRIVPVSQQLGSRMPLTSATPVPYDTGLSPVGATRDTIQTNDPIEAASTILPRVVNIRDSPGLYHGPSVGLDTHSHRSSSQQESHPVAPVVTPRTANAQLARIWSAGEEEQWIAGSHPIGQGQGPPWSWMKSRRRRRKLPHEASTPSTPATPINTTPKPTQTKNSRSNGVKERHNLIAIHASVPSTETSIIPAASENPSLQSLHTLASGRQQRQTRVTLNHTKASPADYDLLSQSLPGGVRVVDSYDSAIERKLPVDFKVTKTGDYGGFSVTKTEELDPISGFTVTKTELDPNSVFRVTQIGKVDPILGSNVAKLEAPDSVVEPSDDATTGRLGTGNENDKSDPERLALESHAHGRQTPAGKARAAGNWLKVKIGRSDVSLSQTTKSSHRHIQANIPLPYISMGGSAPTLAAYTEDAAQETNSSRRLNVITSANTTNASSQTHDAHLAAPESAYSQELFKLASKPTKKLPVAFAPPATIVAETEAHDKPEVTTLSSIFSEDLIPPLPYQWGTAWRSRGLQRTSNSDPEKDTQDGPQAFEIDSDPARLPFELPSRVAGSRENDRVASSETHDAHSTNNDNRYSENDRSWRQRAQQSRAMLSAGMTGPRTPPPGAVSPPTAHRESRKHSEMRTSDRQAFEVRQALGKADLRATAWPGPGERVEFVTVVPGGHWDVWGGPSIWDSMAQHSNQSLRNPQVYSVYWGDTGGPGSPAGWPEGVWVIRGGSLAAIMALVVTISVQVAREGPAHRATPTADAAHHAQHATLATNLATSLASAHILLIFGIQATGKAWVCGVVGLLLHFLHLVSCCWLLALTGRLLGSLLHRRPLHTALYCTASWGASLGLVVVSYVVNPGGYETRRYCWMSVERGMLVSFIVPVCSLILVNAGVCVAAQKVLLDMRDGVKHEVMSRHKRDLRGAVSLLPLEGVSWFLAVVALEDHQSLALDCAAALVSAALGWLVLYFHGWSWRCHGLCWLRRHMVISRTVDDLSLPLTARYDHDLVHQPLLQPYHPATAHPTTANTVTVAPPTTPQHPALPEEFPLQPLFPQTDRREAY